MPSLLTMAGQPKLADYQPQQRASIHENPATMEMLLFHRTLKAPSLPADRLAKQNRARSIRTAAAKTGTAPPLNNSSSLSPMATAGASFMASSGEFPSINGANNPQKQGPATTGMRPTSTSPLAVAAQERLQQQMEATAPHAAFLERLTPRASDQPQGRANRNGGRATAPNAKTVQLQPLQSRSQVPSAPGNGHNGRRSGVGSGVAAAMTAGTTLQMPPFQAPPTRVGRGTHAARLEAARTGKSFVPPNKDLQMARTERARTLKSRAKSNDEYSNELAAATGTGKDLSRSTSLPVDSSVVNSVDEVGNMKKEFKSMSAAPASAGADSTAQLTFGGWGYSTNALTPPFENKGNDDNEPANESNAAKEKRLLSSLRLRVELLWEELHVPMRDRRAVLGAKVKGHGDAHARLSSHLAVLLTHRARTLDALQAIQRREQCLESLRLALRASEQHGQDVLAKLQAEFDQSITGSAAAVATEKGGATAAAAKGQSSSRLEVPVESASATAVDSKGQERVAKEDKGLTLVCIDRSSSGMVEGSSAVEDSEKKDGEDDDEIDEDYGDDDGEEGDEKVDWDDFGDDSEEVEEGQNLATDNQTKTLVIDGSTNGGLDSNKKNQQNSNNQDNSKGNSDEEEKAAAAAAAQEKMDADGATIHERKGLEALGALAASTLEMVGALLVWRSSLWRPRPFAWRGLPNYFEKAARDVDALLQDPSTSTPLSRLLGSAECPALVALLLPLHGSLFTPAPSCPYPEAVTAFTNPPAANTIQLRDDLTSMAWRAALVLAMESTVQSQLVSEANSLRAQGSFMPVLKPSPSFMGASGEGSGGDVTGSGEMAVKSSGNGEGDGNNKGSDQKGDGVSSSSGYRGGMDLGTTWGDLSNGNGNAPNNGNTTKTTTTAAAAATTQPSNNKSAATSFLLQQQTRLMHPLMPPASAPPLLSDGASSVASGLAGFDLRPSVLAHLLKPSTYAAPPQKSGSGMNNSGTNSGNGVALLPPLLGVFPAGHGSFSSQSSFEGNNNNSSNVSASQGSRAGEAAYYEDLDHSHSSSSYYRDVRGDDEFGSVISVFGEEFVANGGSLDSSLGGGGSAVGSYDAGYSEAKKTAEAAAAEEMKSSLSNDSIQSSNGGGDGGTNTTASSSTSSNSNNTTGAAGAADASQSVVGSAVDEALKHLEEDRDLVRDLQRWLPRAASDAIHEAVANAVSQDHLSAFDALDSNGNGYLDAGELLPLMQDLMSGAAAAQLVHPDSFTAADKRNGGGGDSKAEDEATAAQQAVVTSSSSQVTSAQLQRLANAFDRNGDGQISRDEFSEYVRTVLVMAWLDQYHIDGRVALQRAQEYSAKRRASRYNPNDGSNSENKSTSQNHRVPRNQPPSPFPRSSTESIESMPSLYSSHVSLESQQHAQSQEGGGGESLDRTSSHLNAQRDFEENDLPEVLAQLPAGYEAHWSPEYSCFYFYDPSTEQTSWEAPVELRLPSSSSSSNESLDEIGDNNNNGQIDGGGGGGGSRRSIGGDSSSSSSRRSTRSGAWPRSRVQELEDQLQALTNAQSEAAKAAASKEQAFNEALAMATEEAKLKEHLHVEALATAAKDAKEKEQQHAAALAAAAEAAAEQIVASAAEAAAEATRKVHDELDKVAEDAKKPACTVYPENLNPVEHGFVVQEYMEHRVEGLNMATFQNAVSKVMTTCPGTAFTAKDVPRTKDLKKAFELADVDKSGVVDLDEFLGLYSKIKAGQVDGLAGYGMFERRKKK